MNNPQAFPQLVLSNNGAYVEGGMTLRDYMAAKAMQGIYASNTEHDHEDEHIFDAVAEAAYLQADAMLKAREA
jgi:hypothetical protein